MARHEDVPASEGFDLGYRPESYWDVPDAVSAVLANIKGERRREMVRDAITRTGAWQGEVADLLGEIDPSFLEAGVEDELRTFLGRLHPQFMGGEYLPDYLPRETEIARVVLDSTTMDVYSLRARQGRTRIDYRLVDEYETPWWLAQRTSRRPLTMAGVIRLIDTATFEDDTVSMTDDLRESCAAGDGDLESAARFVTVRSDIYPELGAYYARRARLWYEAARLRYADDGGDGDAADGASRL